MRSPITRHRGLPRARRARPRDRAAKQSDEFAPFQSTKFRQVAAIRKGRSIPEDGNQVRTCAVHDFGRAAVRCGSTPEVAVWALMSAFAGSGHSVA
jgi:hypothetical protein